MNLNLLLIKNKLKSLMQDNEIIEIVIFGSSLKGKIIPRDIDIAVILYKKPSKELIGKIHDIKNFHISILTIKEFFVNSPSLVNTLIREGYGIKNKKFLAENFGFSNYALFNYSLTKFSPSMKVRLVNILRGKKKGERHS